MGVIEKMLSPMQNFTSNCKNKTTITKLTKFKLVGNN